MEHTVAKGKIVHKEGKYFLDVAGKMEDLPVGLMADKKFLSEQVGQELEVYYSIPTSFVVAVKQLGKRPIILCNVPRPDFLRGITVVTQPSVAVTMNVADYLLQEKVITPETHKMIVSGQVG